MKQKPISATLPEISIIKTNPTSLDLEPFPHKHITNFLKEDFYQDLCKKFNEVLDRGVDPSGTDVNRFNKYTYGFDASFWKPSIDEGYPINEFYSPLWLEYFSKLFNIKLTNDLSITFMHQDFDSKPFTAHTDYSMVGFPKRLPDDTDIRQYNVKYPTYLKDPQQGEQLGLSVQIRSVLALLYLENPPYLEENGGETGLYDSYESYTLNKPLVKVPPLSNSLLTFESNPRSFHTYLPNKAKKRNTMAFWMHSYLDVKVAKHGVNPESYAYINDIQQFPKSKE